MWIRCESGVTEILTKPIHGTVDIGEGGEKRIRIPTGVWLHVVETNDSLFIDGKDIQDAKA